jgi:hypothetical protein
MNHPHVVAGWRFLPGDETSLIRAAGGVGVITERGVDGHPDMVRAEVEWPDGRRTPFAKGEPRHASVYAYHDDVIEAEAGQSGF